MRRAECHREFRTPHSVFRIERPRGVISSVPVSDTGGPGAIPGEAAIKPRTNPTTDFMSHILNKATVLVLNQDV